MVAQLKAQRDELMQLYAKLIANPYLAPQLVPDFRSTLMGTVATLMENGVPVSTDPKIRTSDDVIREGMAELGGMVALVGEADENEARIRKLDESFSRRRTDSLQRSRHGRFLLH